MTIYGNRATCVLEHAPELVALIWRVFNKSLDDTVTNAMGNPMYDIDDAFRFFNYTVVPRTVRLASFRCFCARFADITGIPEPRAEAVLRELRLFQRRHDGRTYEDFHRESSPPLDRAKCLQAVELCFPASGNMFRALTAFINNAAVAKWETTNEQDVHFNFF